MTGVIACIDGTDISTAVSDAAAWASLRLEAPLEFLHVLDKTNYPIESDLSGTIGLGSREDLLMALADTDEKHERCAIEQGQQMLEMAKQRAITVGVSKPASRQRHGDLEETLVEMEEQIRLLVLGNHSQHHRDHLGSRLENVVRTVRRPILITGSQFKSPKQIMIAFDGSATTRNGVEMVVSSPLFRRLRCHLIMVDKDNDTSQNQLQWAQQRLETAGFDVSAKIINGEVESVLCDYLSTHDIDMLVMGAYGHSMIRRFFVGSTTTSVMRNISVPILLVR